MTGMAPLALTTARWLNRRRRVRNDRGEWTDRWSKVLAHTGSYEQFSYGRDHPSDWQARGRRGRGDGPLQRCMICYLGAGRSGWTWTANPSS